MGREVEEGQPQAGEPVVEVGMMKAAGRGREDALGNLRLVERTNVSSGSPYEGVYGFSRVVRVGDRVIVAGTAPIWPDGEVDPDPAAQTRRCIEIMLQAIAEVGGAATDVVRTRMFITDPGDADAIGRAHGEVFSEVRPASTIVAVAALLDPRWKVEMELEALLTG